MRATDTLTVFGPRTAGHMSPVTISRRASSSLSSPWDIGTPTNGSWLAAGLQRWRPLVDAALPVQLGMDLAGAVDTEVLLVQLCDLRHQLGVPDRPRGGRSGPVGVVRGRSDLGGGVLQRHADRLDSVFVAVGVDALHDQRWPVELGPPRKSRPASRWAESTDAARGSPARARRVAARHRSWCRHASIRRSRPAGPSSAGSRGASRVGPLPA